MNDMPFHMSVGSVEVRTTDNRGFTPEEVAERCTDKLLHISEQAPPVIRDQAVAYKQQMTGVIAAYMKQAIRSDRTTVYNAIKDAGHKKLAEYIRKM
jgi:macrodomain Ter protein organizer (MatP/YcbG family)|tara:strand:- start:2388 stop:2678 length:291 start_codon:yes stop_codon:yes gene_type:complete